MKSIRLNKGKFVRFIGAMCLVAILFSATVNFVKYPEQYLPTWKKDLREELIKGNHIAIEYYNDTYIAKGKCLFGEDKDDYLNLTTISGFETTKEGVLLHTTDGNGYFIEK